MTRLTRAISFGGLIASGLVFLVGLGSHEWWIADLLANLRVHSIVTGILSLAMYAMSRKPVWTYGGCALLIVGLFSYSSFPGSVDGEGNHVRNGLNVLSFNLGRAYDRRDEIARYIAASSADIVVLQELSHQWMRELGNLDSQYPHAILEPREGSFGIGILSRMPLKNKKILEFPKSSIPYVLANVDTGIGSVSFMGLHLNWPMNPASFADRSLQIKSVIDVFQSSMSPFVACGDWNLTLQSGWYDYLQESGLSAGNASGGSMQTWPAPFGRLGISIDHCMTSNLLSVHSIEVGPSLGSDHRPILVTVVGRAPDSRL